MHPIKRADKESLALQPIIHRASVFFWYHSSIHSIIHSSIHPCISGQFLLSMFVWDLKTSVATSQFFKFTKSEGQRKSFHPASEVTGLETLHPFFQFSCNMCFISSLNNNRQGKKTVALEADIINLFVWNYKMKVLLIKRLFFFNIYIYTTYIYKIFIRHV